VKYTTDVTALKFKPSTGVGSPSIVVGAGFWTAAVTHSQVTGKSCEIAVNTANSLVASAGDGEPACK
jgi:hypothetical protein